MGVVKGMFAVGGLNLHDMQIREPESVLDADSVVILGPGAFLEPGPEPGRPPLPVPDPGHQCAGHHIRLAGQEHETGDPAHQAGQHEQQQSARPDQVEQDDRDDQQQDARGRLGKCGSHDSHRIIGRSSRNARPQTVPIPTAALATVSVK